MKIKFYTNVHEDAEEKNLEFFDIEIVGKIIRYSRYPKTITEVEEYGYEDSMRFFNYEYDTKYKNIFPNIKLNCFIKIQSSEAENELLLQSSIGGKNGYCHLNFFQKFKLSWCFKNTWIQKSENIKWLVSIPISILTAYITTILLS